MKPTFSVGLLNASSCRPSEQLEYTIRMANIYPPSNKNIPTEQHKYTVRPAILLIICRCPEQRTLGDFGFYLRSFASILAHLPSKNIKKVSCLFSTAHDKVVWPYSAFCFVFESIVIHARLWEMSISNHTQLVREDKSADDMIIFSTKISRQASPRTE